MKKLLLAAIALALVSLFLTYEVGIGEKYRKAFAPRPQPTGVIGNPEFSDITLTMTPYIEALTVVGVNGDIIFTWKKEDLK